MTPLRIMLADDHPVVLAGLRALLQAQPDLTLVGEATDGGEALRLVQQTQPDIAVIDVSMPGMSGIDLAAAITATCQQVRLLALTVHEDRAYVQQMLRAGVRGYLLKRSAADELLRALRAIAQGGLYLDPTIAGSALPDRTASLGAEPHASLSQREEDVLRCTARGLSNKEIAFQLEISVKTVETYKARATDKLALRTRAQIVLYGSRHGWLQH